ncbi:MAG: spore cortex biosynthesis protein YabQ [Ignavibacteriales bacterium]
MNKLAVSVSSQVIVFFCCILGGLIIGLLFDIFRLSRRIIPTSDLITYIEDIIFWVLVGVIVLVTIFQFNQGQLRGFVFLGMFLGLVFYFMLFSNLLIRLVCYLFSLLEKITRYVIKLTKKPIKIIVKMIAIPIRMIWFVLKKAAQRIKLRCKKIFANIKRSKKIITEKV